MIHINLIGYDYSHNPGFYVRRPNGLPYYAFIVFRSKSNIIIDGENILIDSPAVFIYKKCQGQYYSGYADEVFLNDWFCFSCGEETIKITETEYGGMDWTGEAAETGEIETLINRLDIPLHTLIFTDNIYIISSMIKDLEYEFNRINKFKNEIIDLKVKVLLHELADNIHQKRNDSQAINFHRQNFSSIRNKIYESHGLHVPIPELAGQLNMSPSYFKSIYRQLFGISPGQDIIKSRIEYACNLLKFENLSVSGISQKCHYSNTEHFIRQFKKHMNCSPNEYRKNNMQNIIVKQLKNKSMILL